ncbi:MAG TPA: LD-carboxypeptidase [Caulobacteraceae bacterium]
MTDGGMKKPVRIGVVAPASQGASQAALEIAQGLAAKRWGPWVEIVAHPQVWQVDGHFAGTDEARARAFVQVANDPEIDAVWFARGGYGSARMAEAAIRGLGPEAKRKAYLGFSDNGALLGALYRHRIGRPAHGPHLQDTARRVGGGDAGMRALSWLVEQSAGSLEPSVGKEGPTAAYNLAILASVLGTPLEPDLTGHVLMLEEVSEPMYRIDRMLFQITSTRSIRTVKGVRLGRCLDVQPNEPDFGHDWKALVKQWCDRAGIPLLGPADIGHDAANKVVPFGR